MPNAIKYSVSAQTLALKKGNYWIGTGDVGKGPTSTTDYWNGITPPSGGYTIYLNKASGGPSIYTAANDSQLISLSNTIAGQTFATAAAALAWFATQTDKMVFNADYPAIVTNGLILNLDAGFTPSYPTTGTTWYDVSSGGNNGALTNGPTFNSGNGGSILFDGVNDYVTLPSNNGFQPSSELTLEVWFKSLGSNGRTQGLVYLNFGTGLRLQNNGAIHTRINSSGSLQQFTTTTTYFNGLWNHVMLTIVSPTAKLYVNSSLVDQYSILYDGSSPFDTSPGAVGADVNDPANRGLYGYLSVARVYNKVLSQAEVQQNYNAQKGRFGL
jgi:hypothetical protein